MYVNATVIYEQLVRVSTSCGVAISLFLILTIFFLIKQCQLINEIKPIFYCFNNVISLTYVFYLILHLVYKFLYLYHILSCFTLFLILHVLVAFCQLFY